MNNVPLRRFVLAATLCVACEGRAAVVLPNLPAGSQYQLVFVTASSRGATSAAASDYNTFVTQQAAQNTALPYATWRAVISTPTLNANQNAPTSLSVPIYNTNGQLIATGSSDFWFPTHLAATNYDQFGLLYNTSVWTGSNPDGTAASPASASYTTFGTTTYTDRGWINDRTDRPDLAVHPVYALSSTITAVPEPHLSLVGTVVIGLVILGQVNRRVRCLKVWRR